MASPWAGLVVGGPILADSNFSGGYESDFTKPLDGGVVSTGILGTSKGFNGDPFNFTYPTDGDWKVGSHLQFHQNYATGYQFPLASSQINGETQHYVHFHGKDTEGANPHPMGSFEKRNSSLILKSREATVEDESWARIKGFVQTNDASHASYQWFKDNNLTIPLDWAPDSAIGSGSNLVFFKNMYANWISTKISTYNRRSMSFGRTMSRVKVPFGYRFTGNKDSSSQRADTRNYDTLFPAVWDLEDVPALCDINGRRQEKGTSTPGNPGAGGVLTEWDMLESFFDNKHHLTSHHYKDGNQGYDTIENGVNVRKSSRIQTNHTPPFPPVLVAGQAIEIGMDRFPPYRTEPGKIVYHINGIIFAIYDMPDYIGQPKIMYESNPKVPWLPMLNSDDTVKRLGSQVYENGEPAFAHFCTIINTAFSGNFTLRQARSAFLKGNEFDFDHEAELEIEWNIMKPLAVENPDSRPFINYSAGEFGGSHSTDMGPIIKGLGTGTETGNGGTVVTVPIDIIGEPDPVEVPVNEVPKPKQIVKKWVPVKARPEGGFIMFPEFDEQS